MFQIRVDLCAKLPADHPFQPPVVEPLNIAPTDATTIGDQAGSESANLVETSGELPSVESELEKASEATSGEVASESPQQQTPNLQTASTTSLVIPDHIESLSFIEQISKPEIFDMEVEISNSSSTSVPDEPLETNTLTIPINDQPSTSNLAIQPCALVKTNVPYPPTLFLDSTILADVCENIFQELNKLIQAMRSFG